MSQYEPLAWELQSDDFRYSGDFFAHIPADQDRDEDAIVYVELTGFVTLEESEDMSAFIPGTQTNVWELLTERTQRRLTDWYAEEVLDRERDRWEAAQEAAWEARMER